MDYGQRRGSDEARRCADTGGAAPEAAPPDVIAQSSPAPQSSPSIQATPPATAQQRHEPEHPTPITQRLARLEAKHEDLSTRIAKLEEHRDPNDLLTRDEAAGRLGISVSALDNLRKEGAIAAIEIGRRVLFAPATIDVFIRANVVRTNRRSNRRGGSRS